MPKTPAKSPGTKTTPQPDSATATPTARSAGKRKAAAPEDATPKASKKPKVLVQESTTVSTPAGKGSDKKHTHTSVKVEVPVVSTPVAKPAAKQHIIFNDEEPSEYFTPPQEAPKALEAGVQPKEDVDEEDEDEDGGESDSDSDDDAPEAVSTHAAAAQAAKSAQAATSAVEK